jgi:predicted ATPase with chaperone activity
MMKQYEDLGLSRKQAEALTMVVSDVLRRNIDMLADTYVSTVSLEMSELRAQSSIAGFRAEVMKIQELQEATSVREMERLQANLDKVKSEIRYEVDKLTASQRLDLNLEKGRMRDELQSLRDKSNELEIKVDKEVNSLKAAMEQSKNDTVKYMLGVVMALITAGLGAARLFI